MDAICQRSVSVTACGTDEVGTHVLGTLLLSKHLLLLCNYLCLVLEAQCQREADEEGAGGDDPDDVSDDLAGRFDEARRLGEAGGDFVPSSRRNDVYESGQAFVKRLFAIEFGADGRERDGGGRARRRGGRVRGVVLLLVLFLDDLDFDHGGRLRRGCVHLVCTDSDEIWPGALPSQQESHRVTVV